MALAPTTFWTESDRRYAKEGIDDFEIVRSLTVIHFNLSDYIPAQVKNI